MKTKKRSINFTAEDQKHLATIKQYTGMCDTVNVRKALALVANMMDGGTIGKIEEMIENETGLYIKGKINL